MIKGLYKTGKQIRIWLSTKRYNQLKRDAKRCDMSLMEYAGLILSGIKINPKKEVKPA